MSKVKAIHWGDFEKWGCPMCGSDYVHSSFRMGNEVPVTCGECKHEFVLLPDNMRFSSFKQGCDDGTSYHVEVYDHPRAGIPKHKYKAPDVRPDGDGEYWKPRGIGYDLAGFVKSKEAGERIVAMFEKALGKKPETWLDFRESEPNWIQVKFQGSEADLNLLYDLTKDTGIITEEIINKVIKRKDKVIKFALEQDITVPYDMKAEDIDALIKSMANGKRYAWSEKEILVLVKE